MSKTFTQTPNNPAVKILGIDPGYDRMGIAVVEKPANGGKETVLYSACFQTSPKQTIYDRLLAIGGEISRLIETYRPVCLAIETIFITKNQKTAMRVAEARGIIVYEASRRSVPVYEYSPMEIKAAVSGDGTADKARMAKMISLLVKLPGKTGILDDEYDAVAVALTHAAIIHSRRLLQK